MPKVSGFELARKIWQLDQNSRTCFFSIPEQNEDEVLDILDQELPLNPETSWY